MEQQLRESAEEQKRQEEERERKRKEDEEKRRKEVEEEERRKKELEEEERRKKEAEEEERRRKEVEEEERRKKEVEEEERRKKEVEEEERRKKELQEEERRKKTMEDEKRKKKEAEEEERRNKEAEEGARRRREMEEEARKNKESDQEEARKMEAEKEELRRKEEEARKEREVAEAEQSRRKVEDEQRKEVETRRRAEELEAKRRREDEQRKREAAEVAEELQRRELAEAERREQERRRQAEEQEAVETKRKLDERRSMESEALDRKIDEERNRSEHIPRPQIEIGQLGTAADVKENAAKRAEEAKDHTKGASKDEAIGDWKQVRQVPHQVQNAIFDLDIKRQEIAEMKDLRTKTREDQLYDEEAAHRLVLLFFSVRAWSENCEGGRVRKAGVPGASSQMQVCRKFAESAAVAHDWARKTQAFACWSRFSASTASAALDRKAQDQLAAAAQQVAETTCKQSVLLQQVAHLEQEVAKLSQEKDTLSGDLEALLHNGLGAGQRNSQEKTSDLHGDRTQKLEADLDLAEKMLRACEKENENLASQNRQLRQGARLRREEVDGRQLQLVAELNAAKASADANPASMARLVDLERELVAVKERADEHAKELERCREAKRQLEREMITGPLPKAAHSEELEHAEARLVQSRNEVSELQAKLLFYAQGQQEMEEDRRQVLRLGEELRAALGENAELRKRPAKEASKKIAELRKQNEELHECLRKRHPDSLLALIKACEPPPEEKRKLSELKGRVAELEAQLAEQDALYDRRIRALRAQYDHMRHEYERRAAINRVPVLETEEPKRAAPDREAILQARIKDLERQVEHTKSYYLSKLRKREPLVPSGKSNKATAPTNPSGHGAHHNQGGDARHVQQLQLQLQAQEDRIAELTSASASMRKEPCSIVFLRLLLASPEALALLAFCVIQRWLHTGSGNSEEVRKQILQDAEAQAGLDHRLPWNQLLAVLARAGVPPGLLDLCCQAAPLDFAVSLEEFGQLLQGSPVGQVSPVVDVSKALARLRLCARDSPTAAIHRLDSTASGFVRRGEFTDALQALPCAFSAEERHQVASLFAPPGDLQWVCYPLFLQFLADSDEAGAAVSGRVETIQKALAPQAARLVTTSMSAHPAQPTHPAHAAHAAHSQLRAEKELLTEEASEAKAESTALRGQLKTLEARCEKQALQVAELSLEPAQIVRRLQGEVAFLENRVLEQQAALEVGAKKAELTLRAELDVKSHEVLTLRRTMEARENEVRRYQQELEAIIAELSVLRGS
ncbi:unnamed protein product [Symbiodinium sp. KB8]|nr:unnamed protein product [Symbiodinium sp. KB8]